VLTKRQAAIRQSLSQTAMTPSIVVGKSIPQNLLIAKVQVPQHGTNHARPYEAGWGHALKH
jgi:hypothetical protein